MKFISLIKTDSNNSDREFIIPIGFPCAGSIHNVKFILVPDITENFKQNSLGIIYFGMEAQNRYEAPVEPSVSSSAGYGYSNPVYIAETSKELLTMEFSSNIHNAYAVVKMFPNHVMYSDGKDFYLSVYSQNTRMSLLLTFDFIPDVGQMINYVRRMRPPNTNANNIVLIRHLQSALVVGYKAHIEVQAGESANGIPQIFNYTGTIVYSTVNETVTEELEDLFDKVDNESLVSYSKTDFYNTNITKDKTHEQVFNLVAEAGADQTQPPIIFEGNPNIVVSRGNYSLFGFNYQGSIAYDEDAALMIVEIHTKVIKQSYPVVSGNFIHTDNLELLDSNNFSLYSGRKL